MKMSALAVALTFPLIGSARHAPAQPPAAQQKTLQQRGDSPQRAAVRISRQLNLSPDQTAKLESILAARRQKLMALRADTSLNDVLRKKQIHTVQMSTRMQMANVLTPDQLNQLKAMQKKRAGEASAAPAI